MRDPQFMRAFRQVRKLGCDPAQQDVKFELYGRLPAAFSLDQLNEKSPPLRRAFRQNAAQVGMTP
jgi:hypothetical protein